MVDIFSVFLGSSVVAAVVTGLISVVVRISDRKREDHIRQEERAAAREDHAAEVGLEDRRERARLEKMRLEKRAEQGRQQARILLGELEELQEAFDREGPLDVFQTYGYQKDLQRHISSTIRLIPDAEFREYLTAAMQVITDLWVPASVGEGPEYPAREQSRILSVAIAQVGRFITDDGGTGLRLRRCEAPRTLSTSTGRSTTAGDDAGVIDWKLPQKCHQVRVRVHV